MLKIDNINQEAYLDPTDKLEIGGAFGGEDTTFGSILTTLEFGQGVKKNCKFHIIRNTDTIPGDGILGADFLQGFIIMDCVANKMYCFDKNSDTLIKISDNFGSNKATMEDIAPWRKYGKGIGQKILREKGYQIGTGLGRYEQGIIKPITAIPVKDNCKLVGISIYPRPEIETNTTREKEVYTEMEPEEHCNALMKIETYDTERAYVREGFFNYPNDTYTVQIGPRATEITAVRIKEKGKRYCPAGQIQDGIFSTDAIVKSTNGYAKIAITNTTNKTVELSNFFPPTEPLHRYKEIRITQATAPTALKRKTRFEELLNILKFDTLTEIEKIAIERVCWEYLDVFHMPGDKLTFTNIRKFQLPLTENAPITNKKQYRLPEKHRHEIQRQIDKLKDDDIVEDSISPYNSPVILVPKKGVDANGNKLFRMCVDFRELNKVSIPYSFPLPRIEDILDQLGGSTYFTTLDLSQGFHQVLIDEHDREKTAFSSNFGHYQYKRCPFGLKTLPGFFQSLLNGVLSGLQGVKCFVYIDDVVIFADTFEEHLNRISEVFQRFRGSNLKLNPQKCNFLRKEIMYLGHKCSTEGVQPDERLVKAVQDFPRPNTVRKLQSFLGLTNYYRQFIKDFARKAGPMYESLKGAESSNARKLLNWTTDCEQSFLELKQALVTAPVLIYPNFNKNFTITCDASIEGLGAVLEQEKRPIAYASRTLTDAEKGWSATELELNAVVYSWVTFKTYILGRHVKIYSDHMPLKGVLKMKDTASRIVRLQQKLLDCDYEIIYKKGKENSCADFLSRNPVAGPSWTLTIQTRPRSSTSTEIKYILTTTDGCEDTSYSKCMAITRRQSASETNKQQQQKANASIIDPPGSEPRKKDSNTRTTTAQTLPTTKDDDDDEAIEWLELEDQLNNTGITIITKDNDMKAILQDYHDSVFGGHFGTAKTYSRIKKHFYWVGMKSYITEYIKHCIKCQTNKVGRATKMLLCETDLSKKPFDKIYIDMVGAVTMSASGNQYILSVIDDLTRFVDFVAVPDQTANTIARALYEHVLCRYTLPKVIISDNGTNFLSEILKELCKLLKIDKRQISPYSPQGNLVERQHSTLANYLRCFIDKDPTSWDTYLRTAAHAYNNTPHVSTGYAPMELLFGFTSDIPSSLKNKPTPLYNYDAYYHELRYKLQTSFNIAKEKLGNAKSRSKQYYDRSANPRTFYKGQRVFMKNANRSGKFSPHWMGPYLITEVHNTLNVTIQIGRKLKKVHVNRLKPAKLNI